MRDLSTAPSQTGSTAGRCPACGAALQLPAPMCPACRLPLVGRDAAHLWTIDERLAVVEQQAIEHHHASQIHHDAAVALDAEAVALRKDRVVTMAKLRAQPAPLPPPPRPATAPPPPPPPSTAPAEPSIWARPAPPAAPAPVAAAHAATPTAPAAPTTPATPTTSPPPPPTPATAPPIFAATVTTAPPAGGAAPPPPRPPATPAAAPRPHRELGLKPIQLALLVLGGVLLTAAALVFAIVAWPRLDDLGRALVLVGVTVLAGGIGAALNRRLPATAETLFAVALGFTFVDWYALRRGGLGADLDAELWWTIGTAAIGAVAVGIGRITGRVVLRVIGALSLQASVLVLLAWLAVPATRDAWLLALAAAASLVVGRALLTTTWRPSGIAVLTGSSAFALFAVGVTADVVDAATRATAPPDSRPLAALAVLALVVPIAAGRVLFGGRWPRLAADGLVGLGAAIVVGALTLFGTTWLTGPSTTIALALAATAVLLALWVLPPAIGRGTAVTAGAALALAAIPAATYAADAATIAFRTIGPARVGEAAPGTPVSQLVSMPAGDAAWMQPALVLAAIVLLAVLTVAVPVGRLVGRSAWPAARGVATGAAVAALLLVPLALDLTLLVTVVGGLVLLVAAGAASVELDRRHHGGAAALAAVLAATAAVPAFGWSLADHWLTVAALATLTAAATLATLRVRTEAARPVLTAIAGIAGLALTPTIAVAAHVELASGALASAVVAAAVLVAAAWGSHRPTERAILVTFGAVTLAGATVVVGAQWATAPWFVVAAAALVTATTGAVTPRVRDVAARASVLGLTAAAGLTALTLVPAALTATTAVIATTTAVSAAALVVVAAWLVRPATEQTTLAAVGTIALTGATVVVASQWATAPWFVVAAAALVTATTGAVAPRLRDLAARAGLLALTAAAGLTAITLVPAALATSTTVVALTGAVAGCTLAAALTAAHLARSWGVPATLVAWLAGSVGLIVTASSWWNEPWATVAAVSVAFVATFLAASRTTDATARAALVAAAGTTGMILPAVITAAAGAPQAPVLLALAAATGATLAIALWVAGGRVEGQVLAGLAAVGLAAAVAATPTAWSSASPWYVVAAVGTATAALVGAASAAAHRHAVVLGEITIGLAVALGLATVALVPAALGTAAVTVALTLTIAAATLAGLATTGRLDRVPYLPGLAVAWAGTTIGLVATSGWWPRSPWSTVGALAATFAATTLAAATGRHEPVRLGLTVAAAVTGVALAPTAVAAAAGSAAQIGLAIAVGAAVLVVGGELALGRTREADALALVGATGLLTGLAITLGSWSSGPWYAVAAAATSAVTASLVAVRRHAWVRDLAGGLALATALVTALTAALAAGASLAGAAVAVVLPAGAALVSTTLLTTSAELRSLRTVLEAVAGAGLAVGTIAAFGEPVCGAVALTALVPTFAAAGLRDDRTAYRWAAGVAALGAVWTWLFVGEVTVVEAYTLPAAVAALAAGWVARHKVDPTGHEYSWLVFGPALALGLLPSLGLVVTVGGAGRAIALTVAAIAVVLAGVRWRLQAPLAIGAATLVTLAVDTLWPVAAQVPRWVLLALAGALFVWLGATFEHRRRDLHHARDSLSHLH